MSLSPAQADAIIDAVRHVSRTEILPLFRRLEAAQIDTKSAADDLVTIADKAAEAALIDAFQAILPEARVIGEESVAEDKSLLKLIGQPGMTVIIDPIDGTWNYANDVATFGVIIAVVVDGQTEFGLLYDPSHDDWILSHRGQGAWFCRADHAPRKLHVGDAPRDVSEMMGFVGMYLFDKPGQAIISETLPLFLRTLTLRCSCHEYRLLAAGRSDFCLNGMLNAWDHAAGVLIYEEAGGFAQLLTGERYRPDMTHGLLLTAKSESSWNSLAALYRGLC